MSSDETILQRDSRAKYVAAFLGDITLLGDAGPFLLYPSELCNQIRLQLPGLGRLRKLNLPCVKRLCAYPEPLRHLAGCVAAINKLRHRVPFELVRKPILR